MESQGGSRLGDLSDLGSKRARALHSPKRALVSSIQKKKNQAKIDSAVRLLKEEIDDQYQKAKNQISQVTLGRVYVKLPDVRDQKHIELCQ